jgi:hypothetical protein
MLKIYFVTGKVIEIPDYDLNKLSGRLPHLGIRVWRPQPDKVFPIGWDGVMFLEEVITDEEREEMKAAIIADEVPQEAIPEEPVIEEPEPEVKEKKKSAQEKADEALAEMKRLSECQHENHHIYYDETLVGRARKPAKRYFPVCAECGVREKYVKADLLPEEVKANAKLWDK